jgi:DHA2 family multidrug resistance protein
MAVALELAPGTPPPQVAPLPPAAQAAGPSRAQILGFVVMVFGMFMAILDIQIVASSLSEIQAGLSASADEISWVQTSYLIAEVVMIPLSGMLSRMLSTRVLFTLSAVGFTLMSAGCAWSSSIGTMVVFRALQGFLGGAMIPTVFAASFQLFPGKQRGTATIVIGLVATMAPTLGPTLGGYLTQMLSWHWLFLINIVPGIVVGLAVWFLVDIDRPDHSLMRGFDLPGLLFMAIFLGSLEYVLEQGPTDDWFDDETIRALAIIGAVAAAAFLWRVLTYAKPVVDLRAFHDRNFAIGCLFSFVLGTGLYGAVYVMPLYLARVRGFNSLEIGTTLIVTGSFQFLSAPFAGRLATKIDPRIMLGIGLGMFAAAMLLTASLTAEWGFDELFVPQALRGAALMFCFIPINTLALGTLPPAELKNASGLYNLTRNLGGAIGLAAINTVLHDRLSLHRANLADTMTATRPQVQTWLDGLSSRFDGAAIPADPDLAAMKTLSNLVLREAMVMTFNDVLLLMGAVFIAAFVLMPLVRKPKAAAAASEAH